MLGLLGDSLIQSQGRVSRRTHDRRLPGPTGLTAPPHRGGGGALCAQGALGQWWIDAQEVAQLSGVPPHHRLGCDALGLDFSWYALPSAPKNGRDSQTP